MSISKFTIIGCFLIFGQAKAQDTIRDVYAPKHMYLPFSFGFSDHFSLGHKFRGDLRDYVSEEKNADCYKSFRIFFNYTAFKLKKGTLDFGINLDFYNYRVMGFVDDGLLIAQGFLYTPEITSSQQLVSSPFQKKRDYFVTGVRFSPYMEYNHLIKKMRRGKQSAGIQLNYGFHAEAVLNVGGSVVSDYPNNHYRFYGLPQNNSAGVSSYGGLGLQLHYDYLYVHTNFSDWRLRAYYYSWFPNGENALSFVNGIGLGVYLHVGRHFPKLDKL